MLGKLNMDEFAMGSSKRDLRLARWENPWRAEGRRTRASPGRIVRRLGRGVAAACASARPRPIPAARPPARGLHGTVGIKPTYGRCSRWGRVAFAVLRLDQAGPIAKTVEDAAILLPA
jgi:aspartyl-tRNA(Asn)/glutamyl-tRNA(Gln) amidotransferase subunit A